MRLPTQKSQTAISEDAQGRWSPRAIRVLVVVLVLVVALVIGSATRIASGDLSHPPYARMLWAVWGTSSAWLLCALWALARFLERRG